MTELARVDIRGSDEPVKATVLRQVIDRILQWRENVNQRFENAAGLYLALEDRVTQVEGQVDTATGVAIRLQVVADITDLPVNASPLQWFRVQGDPAIYIGNGPTLPLRKVPTQAV